MSNDEQRLINGNIWKGMLLFSFPLILSNLAQVLFNMSDIAVVGKFSTDTALGEVGSTATLVTLFIGFLIGMANGVNVVVAKNIGKNDKEYIHHSIHTSFLLCLFMGIIILLLGVIFSHSLLVLLNTKPEFINGATLYLQIFFLGMPGLALYNFGNATYSAYGETKKPLFFLLGAGVINICLNLFFVLGLRMSVDGVAIASVVSQYLSALLVIISLMREKGIIHLSLKDIRIYQGQTKEILALGIPSGIQSAIFAIANLFIQSGVNSLDSVMVEGCAASQNADALIYDAMAAFYMAGSSYISQNYGARKKKRILKSYFISIVYSFGIGAILSLLLMVFGRNFLSLFTNKQEVIEAGMVRVYIMGCSYAVSSFMDASIAASRGLGHSLIPTIIVILGSCVFRVIWVYTVFAYYKTAESLFLLYIFSWVITSIVEIAYFIYLYRYKIMSLEEK